MQNSISDHITKFHENPTVNETRIVVLMRSFWLSAGKEKTTVRKGGVWEEGEEKRN